MTRGAMVTTLKISSIGDLWRTQSSARILLSTVVILICIDKSLTIKCFKCQVAPQLYKIENKTVSTPPLCSKFDESEDYEVDCPYSTMCVKKILKFYLQNGGTIDTVTRDCASQKYTDQVFRQGNWQAEHKVEEPYQEGCEEFKENSLSGSSTTYCYCRGNLCNSAMKKYPSSSLQTSVMAVIFVFNAIRWLTTNSEIF